MGPLRGGQLPGGVAPGALLYPTALQEKRENIHPLPGGELMRAILTGHVYPRLLLSAVLQRIRAGDPINGRRSAICKAWLTGNARLFAENPTDIPEDYLVSLNTEEKDPAYRLGRLFAVLEHIQYRALGSVNAGVRDRYFGTASASSAGVFPLLLRGSNHHLSVLRKKPDTKRLAAWFEGEIGDIMNELPMNLPRHFGLEDQGRFVVGHHHQRFAAKSDKSTAQTSAESLSEERMDNRTMGRKHIIPYGLYRAHGSVSAHLARETGFDETDLENLWAAPENMFDHDRSAARGEMNARKLIVFKHDNALGRAAAHKLFDRVKIERVIKGDNAPPARAFTDYEVTVLRENPPAGVEIIERL